ncbi:enoyl-CoA hydratase-related protein [Metabacillus sp. 84]|uniref:enoyl-CoA hydratase-related protein n=1 Tax=unclassified Metabacillus TaxID=2675274 RepID=UPI003CF1D297
MYETIKLEQKNGTAWLTLNRPDKLNAFTGQMNKEIVQALKAASSNEEIRCLVITGEGRAFSSGEDLGSIGEETDHGEIVRTRYNPMVKALAAFPKPVIAAVNGVAAGAGFSLALACDFRIASEKASFIQSFIHVGLVPDSGNHFYLPRIIGTAKALELALLGEKIDSRQAKELGLVTLIVEPDLLEQETAAFADRLAAMPTAAIGLIKRAIHGSFNATLDEMLEKEAQYQRIAGLSEDHREGTAAFLEKRKPQFSGK